MTKDFIEKLYSDLQGTYIDLAEISVRDIYFQKIIKAKDHIFYLLNTNDSEIKDHKNNILFGSFAIMSVNIFDDCLNKQYRDVFNGDYLDLWCLSVYFSYIISDRMTTQLYTDRFENILEHLESKNSGYDFRIDEYAEWLKAIISYYNWTETTKYNKEKIAKGLCTAICHAHGYGQVKSSDQDVVDCELSFNHSGVHTGVIQRYYYDPIFPSQDIKITWEIDEHLTNNRGY